MYAKDRTGKCMSSKPCSIYQFRTRIQALCFRRTIYMSDMYQTNLTRTPQKDRPTMAII